MKTVHSSQAASPEEQPQLQQEICIPLPVKAVEFSQVLHPALPEDMIPYDTIMQLVYHGILMNYGIKETYRKFKNLQRHCKDMSDLAKLSHQFTSMHCISFHSILIIIGYDWYIILVEVHCWSSFNSFFPFLFDETWWDKWPTLIRGMLRSGPQDHICYSNPGLETTDCYSWIKLKQLKQQLNYAKLTG